MFDVYVFIVRSTNELMLSAHVPSQITRCSEALLANIAFVRFLVRVNTHVNFHLTICTKTLYRRHRIRTASRSCEYACGLSNY